MFSSQLAPWAKKARRKREESAKRARRGREEGGAAFSLPESVLEGGAFVDLRKIDLSRKGFLGRAAHKHIREIGRDTDPQRTARERQFDLFSRRSAPGEDRGDRSRTRARSAGEGEPNAALKNGDFNASIVVEARKLNVGAARKAGVSF
jgi:hypothetical protein